MLNMNHFDPSFDEQQPSNIYRQTRTQQISTNQFPTMETSSTAVLFENVSSRVSSIEERLNACDSIYRLATQANSVRERERREKFQSFAEYAQSLDKRINAIEENVDKIPIIIRAHVQNELKEIDNSTDIEKQISEARNQLTERMALIEKQYETTFKKSQKELKRLKATTKLATTEQDDSIIDDVAAQIAEMKRRQALMFDLFNAMKSHNSQDFEKVNTQLSTIWAQLSMKRDSPKKY